MSFIQTGPAETTAYMILGFAEIFGFITLHLISLRLRRRSLERDLEILEEDKEQI